MGEGRSPRWGPLVLALVVLLLGVGAYRLVSGPSTPAAPQPAAAAQEQPSPVLAQSGRSGPGDSTAAPDTSVRLGRHVVSLRGPGLTEAHRETSADALGRIGQGWLVKITSTACEDPTDTRTSYGTARASGRFTVWNEAEAARRPTWRSPDRRLVLVENGTSVKVRRTATGTTLPQFPAAG